MRKRKKKEAEPAPEELHVSRFPLPCIEALERACLSEVGVVIMLRGVPLARIHAVQGPKKRGRKPALPRYTVRRDLVQFDWTAEWEALKEKWAVEETLSDETL